MDLTQRQATDPVCGAILPSDGTHATYLHQGREYYFCCQGCQQAFAANPSNYLTRTGPNPRDWFGRYLESIEQASLKAPTFGDPTAANNRRPF